MTLIGKLLEKWNRIEQGLEISELIGYNESKKSDKDEFDYDKVTKELKQKQKQKKPVNVRNKQEKATLEHATWVFTDDELSDGGAVRFTSQYEYTLEVYSDSTYTIIHRKRLR